MRNTSRFGPLAVIGVLLISLTSLGAANAQSPQPRAAAANVPNSFTYQGQLKGTGGALINGTCNFHFSLWDSASNVSGQVGSTENISGVTLTNGLFAVQLNSANAFGANPFDGNARWLQIAVQCGADPGFTALAQRQALTGAPYALGLKLPASEAISDTHDALQVYNNGTGAGLFGRSFGGWGVGAFSDTNTGLQAHSNSFYGVYADSGTGVGVAGVSSGSAAGVYGSSNSGNGVVGNSTSGSGVYGNSSTNAGVWGNNTGSGAGVYGTSNGDGVYGLTLSSAAAGTRGSGPVTGTIGISTNSSGKTFGVYGTTQSNSGYAVYGINSADGTAVYGTSFGGVGVYGSSTTNYGVYGTAPQGFGVYGISTGGGSGVWGDNGNSNTNGNAGYFNGRVQVSQDLTTNGLRVNANGTTFKKVEAGTATIGANGSASTVITVTFPSTFSGTPRVVLTASNDPAFPDIGDTFVVAARRVSTTQVVVNVVRVDAAAGWSQSLKLNWLAWE